MVELTDSTPMPMVEYTDVSKNFGGVRALKGVTLSIARGEVHSLVGENGAGKSTLGKILVGVHRADGGSIKIGGVTREYHDPRDALADGVTGIAQEISLVPHRSAIDNVFLGTETNKFGYVKRRELQRRYRELEERIEFGIPANAIVSRLSIADQQRLEIMRALARRVSVLVLDEPTAALSTVESERLFGLVHRLRDQGTTIVYVSHFLQEAIDLSDRLSVLRDGRLIRTGLATEETPDSLIESMLGHSLDQQFETKSVRDDDAPVRLSVRGVSRRNACEDVSFDVRAGEIVGMAGLVGSGRTETARILFGADKGDAGTVLVDGRPLRMGSPNRAVRAGLVYLPESRKDDGLLMNRSVTENVTLPYLSEVSRAGIFFGQVERKRAQAITTQVKAVIRAPNAPVGHLSGGNQQKVLIARWLFSKPGVLLLDEPTRGVDVGAKAAIYGLIRKLADDGLAVVVISSEHEELVGLAHRVLVMRAGRIVAELDGRDNTEDAIVSSALKG